MIDVTDLLGKQFDWQGVGPDSYSCWTLARTAAQRYGYAVPDWPVSSDANVNHAHVLEAIAGQYERLEKPEAGCFVLFRTQSGPHIGTMLGPDKFLHITKDTRSCIERISSPLVCNHVVGFYRWKGGKYAAGGILNNPEPFVVGQDVCELQMDKDGRLIFGHRKL